MNDLVLILSEVATNDEGGSYPITGVLRYDFQGSREDLLKLIKQHPDLFIEGGIMINRD